MKYGGLTRLQFKYLALYREGWTQDRIAKFYGTNQPRVAEVLGRARKRRPDLFPNFIRARREREL